LDDTRIESILDCTFEGENTRKIERNREKTIYLVENQFPCPRKLLGILDTVP
jgi:hypothetical protein